MFLVGTPGVTPKEFSLLSPFTELGILMDRVGDQWDGLRWTDASGEGEIVGAI